MFEDVSSVFVEGLRRLGLVEVERGETVVATPLYQAFMRYRQELLEWNTRFNLTAIKDPEEVLLKHFLDSLSLLQAYDQPEVRVLDIGSGAGFPGLPLKIARPAWHVTLLEATGKRVTFLQHMVDVLELENVEVVKGRAEEVAHKPEYRGAFDMVTARAVSSFSTLLEYGAPYCKVGGVMLWPKKGELDEELAQGKRAAGIVGARLERSVTVDVPGLEDGRKIFVWQQQRKTPEGYPRSGSAMSKKPLG